NMLLRAEPGAGGGPVEGNVEIVAMLDWETAHLGDPLEDLGWITNPLRRREHQIPGVWERADIARRYEELTGLRVTEADLRFWNVLANFKLAVIVLTGARSFVEGRGDRVFTAPSALVALMFELIGSRAEASRVRPTPEEQLRGLREVLERVVAPELHAPYPADVLAAAVAALERLEQCW